MTTANILRQIPKVDEILKDTEWQGLVAACPEAIAKEELRRSLDDLRLAIKEGRKTVVPSIAAIIGEVRLRVAALTTPGLRRVINGTGVIIHTNLGRSLLAGPAVAAIINAATHFTNLEYDIENGARGDRYEHCSSILKRLTGVESALVVNNNAAAVFLILNTIAEGKEVIISRGELVEIGGSFRIPDVMKKSGAILREVGTTNRTYVQDYENAISEQTAIIMKVHTSNFRIRGFVHETSTGECVELGRKYGIPTFYDAGSGLFFHTGQNGMYGEPCIIDETAKDIDLICFSGDKLLGAPQAGIILGKKIYVDSLKKNPMTRALRPDKLTLAGLESTLLLYLDREAAIREIPTLGMMYETKALLRKRAGRIVIKLKKASPGLMVKTVDLHSEVGGGTLPDVGIPSCGIALIPDHMSVTGFEARLRGLDIPIVGRIERDALILDMRTILSNDEPPLISGILQVLAGKGE